MKVCDLKIGVFLLNSLFCKTYFKRYNFIEKTVKSLSQLMSLLFKMSLDL